MALPLVGLKPRVQVGAAPPVTVNVAEQVPDCAPLVTVAVQVSAEPHEESTVSEPLLVGTGNVPLVLLEHEYVAAVALVLVKLYVVLEPTAPLDGVKPRVQVGATGGAGTGPWQMVLPRATAPLPLQAEFMAKPSSVIPHSAVTHST
ncbi:MAG: hypothetical protein HYZ92_02990 [Candidatus Omnitrophica bacterium]|nr:hypothetical protein [Candidatus Omnitrophota bacterium]